MNNLECPHGCGRKFEDHQKLEDHIKRRHFLQQKGNQTIYDNSNTNEMQKRLNLIRPKLPQLVNKDLQTHQTSSIIQQQQISESIIKQLPPKPLTKLQLQFKKNPILRPSSSNMKQQDDVQKIGDQKDKDLNDNKETQKVIKIIEPSPVISAKDLVEARKLITKQFICTNSDGSDLESVTHLSLNDKNLLVFESTTEVPFQELIALKSLSLSQNKLINVIGISVLHNIVDLNLNNNQISTLQPLGECKRLQKLYVNSNLINTIDMGLMIHLKIFQIGNNQITDFEHLVNTIKLMPSLKDLVVENNPCTNKYAYKYDILWTIFLDKLDNQIITQQDYNLAQAFKDSKQESKLSQSINFTKGFRPQTASNNNNSSLLIQDQQNDNSQNNLVLEQINQELEEEIEELYDINYNLREKIDRLEKQNVEYRIIADRVPFLEEQLQDMRSKISAYETLIIFKDSPDVELRKHIFALTQELEQLKTNQNIDNYEDENHTKFNINQSKFQNTQTTFIQQLSQVESDSDNKDDDDDKYFRDDDNISQIPGQEIMELIMRNSMTLSKLKSEFKDIN